MKGKIIISVLLGVFILLPGSWFHDMIILMVIVFIWRKEIKTKLNQWWKYGYVTMWGVMGCLTLLLMPRPFALPTDRVRHVYFNEKGEKVSSPFSHWMMNVIMPEETMCALGSVVPLPYYLDKEAKKTAEYRILGKRVLAHDILKDYFIELEKGGLWNIGKAYRKNSLSLESPMSGVIPQAFCQHLDRKERSVYIIKPKGYDKNRKYPVLFFAHGYLGNWKLYTGLLRDIKDHIVVCIGTEDYKGHFSSNHIKEIRSLYLPLLENMRYKVDNKAISLMGLSNGGSAIDAAYAYSPNSFKNLIYVSTGVNHSSKTKAKVMIIGGGKDHCASSMRTGMKRLVANNVPSSFCFDENHTHFKLVSDMENCIEFLNREL